jgi:hypothetical protein
LHQLGFQPLWQLHAVHESPSVATATAHDGPAVGLRATTQGVSELPNERQVLRVLASAYAAAFNARRASHREAAAEFLMGRRCLHV